MKKALLICIPLIAAVFAGCSDKEHELSKIFTPNKVYEKALVNTRETQIVRSLETKATISATLLCEVFPKKYPYAKGITFFVGIVSDKNIKGDTIPSNDHISLNGMTPIDVKKVKKDDFLYTLMPSVNRWGSYYLVTFAPVEKKQLNLNFEMYPYGSVDLKFQRSILH